MSRKFIFCSSYVWHYAKCYAKPDITECFMVIFVKQPDKTLLDWCENKWINYLNAKINIFIYCIYKITYKIFSIL